MQRLAIYRYSFKSRSKRSAARDQNGQSIVEFAVILPVFLIVLFGIVDLGWALKSYVTLTNLSREGARVGVVCSGGTVALAKKAVEDQVVKKSGDLDLTAANITATVPCDTGKDVIVELAYDHNYITPLGSFVEAFTGAPLHLKVQTTMRAE